MCDGSSLTWRFFFVFLRYSGTRIPNLSNLTKRVLKKFDSKVLTQIKSCATVALIHLMVTLQQNNPNLSPFFGCLSLVSPEYNQTNAKSMTNHHTLSVSLSMLYILATITGKFLPKCLFVCYIVQSH